VIDIYNSCNTEIIKIEKIWRNGNASIFHSGGACFQISASTPS
jgi:hypothetical protein